MVEEHVPALGAVTDFGDPVDLGVVDEPAGYTLFRVVRDRQVVLLLGERLTTGIAVVNDA